MDTTNEPVALTQADILGILQDAYSVPLGQPIFNSSEEYNKLKAIIESAIRYTHPVKEQDGCGNCHACLVGVTEHGLPVTSQRMILCPDCGNKRCPKASNHRHQCTESNEPNQRGSIYTHPAELTDEDLILILEVLIDSYDDTNRGFLEYEAMYKNSPMRKARIDGMKRMVDKHTHAIEMVEAILRKASEK